MAKNIHTVWNKEKKRWHTIEEGNADNPPIGLKLKKQPKLSHDE